MGSNCTGCQHGRIDLAASAGFNLRTKYKGHHNRNTQIRSTFSQDGTFLICGSDDGWVYIWTTGSGTDDEKMPKQVLPRSWTITHLFSITTFHPLRQRDLWFSSYGHCTGLLKSKNLPCFTCRWESRRTLSADFD